MEHPHRSASILLAWGLASLTLASEHPAPTPTPRPGSLAAVAGTTSLRRPHDANGDGPILITDDNLEALADGAVVTVVTAPVAAFTELTVDPGVDPAIRARWRKMVLAQGKILARLEARRLSIESEIDRLGRGRLDSRTLDRIEKAEAKLGAVDHEIAREKSELSRLVREARKEGAQPGWFR